MARQQILWTVMPFGREHREGPYRERRRVSIVVSPRLTPEAADEQVLSAFTEWLDWPQTLRQLDFGLEIAGDTVRLERIEDPALAPDSALWQRLFPPTLGVAGFQFKDMSQVNLRSFPVRHVQGFVRRHYTALSLQAGSGEHPTLLPWQAADPALKGMLGELGTRTQKINFGRRSVEVLLPGFDRFHEASEVDEQASRHDRLVDGRVFSRESCIQAPAQLPGREGSATTFRLRALPPDWEDPAAIRSGAIAVDAADRERRAELMEQFSGPAEYALWQGDRFYHRTRPTQQQIEMRRPTMVGGTDPLKPPEWDFHQRLASYADHPNLLRRLGLVIDCVLASEDAIDALVAAATPANGAMRLLLRGEPPHDPAGDVFPRTAWRATKGRFVVQARTRDHEDGLLRLDRANDRFQNMDPRSSLASRLTLRSSRKIDSASIY